MKISRQTEKGIGLNVLIALLALVLTWILGGPIINIENSTSIILSSILFVAFIFLAAWCFAANKDKATRQGPYKYVRYPIYSGIIFLLNPALAILLHSTFYLIAIIPIYFAWRAPAKNQDLILTKELGRTYQNYRINSSLLLPNLAKINIPAFLTSIGTIVFIAVFVALNFPALSFEYLTWQGETLIAAGQANNISTTTPAEKTEQPKETQQPAPLPQISTAQKYNKTDSIIISKIGVEAPIITSQAKTDKELNQDLNKGVIIYPGSDMPGEIGNLFLTGHSSVYPWNKTPYGKVFAKLNSLEKGDRVVVYYNQQKFEYQIDNKQIEAPQDVMLVHATDKTRITLMTCWPIGNNTKRLVLEGSLVE